MFNKHSACFHRARMCAFSLVELLITLAVIGVLIVLILVGYRWTLDFGKGAKCTSNLRQIGVATASYLYENNGKLPIARVTDPENGSGWSGTAVGAWYWNLAPYLDVPRWATVNKYLGNEGKKLTGPCVFTCPAHGADEPAPITYPSNYPVSYAPSTYMSPTTATGGAGTEVLYQFHISNVKSPAKKIWISDSTQSSSLNVTTYRWEPNADQKVAWPRISFTRHNEGGNALFFDGHVERISYKSIIDGNISANVRELFDPAN